MMTRQLNIFERLPGSERRRSALSLLIRESTSLLIKNQRLRDPFDAVRACCQRLMWSPFRYSVYEQDRSRVDQLVTNNFSRVFAATGTSGIEMKNPDSKKAEAGAVKVRSRQQSGLPEQRLMSFG